MWRIEFFAHFVHLEDCLPWRKKVKRNWLLLLFFETAPPNPSLRPPYPCSASSLATLLTFLFSVRDIAYIIAGERWSQLQRLQKYVVFSSCFYSTVSKFSCPLTKLPRCDHAQRAGEWLMDGYEQIQIDQQSFFRLAWQESLKKFVQNFNQ